MMEQTEPKDQMEQMGQVGKVDRIEQTTLITAATSTTSITASTPVASTILQSESTASPALYMQGRLSITSDFTFCKVMEDNPELCKELVQMIIGDEVGELEFLEKQKQVDITPDGRGVRLDVYCRTTDAVYNIEMQATRHKDLGKRARFYQSMIDADLLDKGAKYRTLPPSFVIFICPEDVFGVNEERCVFKTVCLEHPEAELNTGTHIIFICCTEKGMLRQDSLGHFLRYMKTQKPSDQYTNELEKAVVRASMDADWRKEMYTLQMKIDDEKYYAREEGIQQGIEQGMQQGLKQGELSGSLKTLISLVQDNLLPLSIAAQRAGMSPDDFKGIMDAKTSSGLQWVLLSI